VKARYSLELKIKPREVKKMDTQKTKDEIKKLSGRITEMQARAKDEYRELTREETGLIAECEGCIEALTKSLPERSLSMTGPMGSGIIAGNKPGYNLRGPGQSKDYRALFGEHDGYQWPDKETNFFQAVFSGRHHPGLIRASMSESTPSDGGFLLDSQTAAQIHNVSLENEIVQPLAYTVGMKSNELKIPAMVIGSHASALMGGFVAGYVGEAGTITAQSPKSRSMTLIAKKLVGMIRFTSELAADTVGGFDQIIQICGKGLAWYRDLYFLKGIGAGQPLGVMNAPCIIEVSKETGQKADTIVYENLTKMMARMYAGSFKNSVWVCHQTTIPQLLTLSLSVGTGGQAIPVMNESNGKFTMLTRPVIFTEKTETLGDKGDIMLCDFSQYVVGIRSGMRFDTSIHVAFETDELLSRIIERHDAEPLWDAPLTLEDGVTTVSPFVCLASRA
jgi:HK97 family phage major capsid protein